MALLRCGNASKSHFDDKIPLNTYCNNSSIANPIVAGTAITFPNSAILAYVSGDDFASYTGNWAYCAVTVVDLTTGTSSNGINGGTFTAGHEYLISAANGMAQQSGGSMTFNART